MKRLKALSARNPSVNLERFLLRASRLQMKLCEKRMAKLRQSSARRSRRWGLRRTWGSEMAEKNPCHIYHICLNKVNPQGKMLKLANPHWWLTQSEEVVGYPQLIWLRGDWENIWWNCVCVRVCVRVLYGFVGLRWIKVVSITTLMVYLTSYDVLWCFFDVFSCF